MCIQSGCQPLSHRIQLWVSCPTQWRGSATDTASLHHGAKKHKLWRSTRKNLNPASLFTSPVAQETTWEFPWVTFNWLWSGIINTTQGCFEDSKDHGPHMTIWTGGPVAMETMTLLNNSVQFILSWNILVPNNARLPFLLTSVYKSSD